ncbi:WSCD2 protein, partial [Nothoprocta pentlandii]|nr:WSCD2 protein [Nothoprocta pentlandii]
ARYVGCFEDSPRRRTLRGVSFFDYKKMTVFRCQDNCAERGYLYAGLEFGAECYCGHKIQAGNVSEAECAMACKGERGTTCGGANRLSLAASLLTLSPPQEFPLSALAGTACRCGFPTRLFTLHEREDEQLCAQRCAGDELESCGTADYFLVYQTQVQGERPSPGSSLHRRADAPRRPGRLLADNRCMDRRFLPARSRRVVALASFPGAGNTWARHLIELATGYYTGSYYFDGSLYNKGFKGERDHWRSGRTICVKTHESGQKEIESFDAAILLIRNPYKALMAEFNRKYGGHIGFAAHAHWQGKEWPEFVRTYAPWWATHTLDWLRFGRNVLVVHFEDLKRDLFAQLQRMVALLGVAAREDRLLCVEGQKDGNFKRSGLRKLEYDPYTPEMRALIGGYIKTVDAALRLRNLSGVPDDYSPR